MARPLRVEFEGGLYRVTSRGNRREDIYRTDEDCVAHLAILEATCHRFNWMVYAYCLMSNHYHLLIETPEGNLSEGMHHLNGVYSQAFNRTHQLVGHVFQGRYKGLLVEKESYLLELCRYIVLNPVRAHMVKRAEDWPWSSYGQAIGTDKKLTCLNVEHVRSLFAERLEDAVSRYKIFVSQGLGLSSPWDGLKNQIYLGSDEFVEEMQFRLDSGIDLSDIPKVQRRPMAKSIEHYAKEAIDRNCAIVEAYKSGGYSMKDIGLYFDLGTSTISDIVNDRKSKT